MANASSSSSSAVNSLRSRFEPAPIPPPPEPVHHKDRVKSALDAPRREISGVAARMRDEARKATAAATSSSSSLSLSSLSNTSSPRTPTAILPQERASDSEEARRLKRAILSKDADLRQAIQRMQHLAQKLERLVDRFSASVVADDFIPSNNNTSSISSQSATQSEQQQPISAFANDNANITPQQDLNKIRQQQQQQQQKRMTATYSQPTSLEAILAAARGGAKKESPAASADRPKYAKLLRDMK